jgi:hypothetical protein
MMLIEASWLGLPDYDWVLIVMALVGGTMLLLLIGASYDAEAHLADVDDFGDEP